MKKLSIVLLALLFVTGSLFAAFDLGVTGTATGSFSWDLDGESLGFDAVDEDLSVDFDIALGTGAAETVGEGDLYAHLKATASLKFDSGASYVAYTEVDEDDWDGTAANKAAIAGIAAPADGQVFQGDVTADGVRPFAVYDDDEGEWVYYNWTTSSSIATSVSVTEFMIFAGDFTIDLLGAPTALDKAKGFAPITGDAKNVVKGGLTAQNGGIKVLYQDLTFGFDFLLDNSYNDLGVLLYAGWAGEMDGMDLAFAAGYNTDSYLALSASAGLDLDGLALNVAVDMADIVDNFAVDVAVGTVLDLGDLKPAVDIYYAYDGDNWLGAQARVADLDLGGIVAGVTVEALDILDAWEYNAKLSTKIDDLTLTVDGGVKKGVDFKVNGKVDYVYDIFIISANGGYDSAKDEVPMGFSVSSTGLIDNSTVKLGWATDDVTAKAGKITASVAVSF